MTNNNFAMLAGCKPLFDQQDHARMTEISRDVRGYSDARQYSFFRSLFALTDVSRVLILGVYFGRDIVFMLETSRRCGRPITITGVDKFSDDACADWPAAQKLSTWSEAGFGPAPSLAAAEANINRFRGETDIRLIQRPDEEFLLACREKFDFIYIDTSHDYETVRRQLRRALPLLGPGGLLAGDDYSDQGTWGVRRAVSEAAPGHALFANWIWIATREHILPTSPTPKVA